MMKIRFIAAVLAAFFLFPALSVSAHGDDEYCPADDAPVLTAYAEPQEEPEDAGIIDITPRTEAPTATITVTDNVEPENTEQPTPAEEPAPAVDNPAREPDEGGLPDSTGKNPFTPSGTGEVVDNATESDGKEFFTITTPDENTFYLIIDRQRTGENVYLLNAVTEADLLSLAKMPEQSALASAVTEPTPATAEPEPTPAPEKNGSAGMMVIVILVVLGGGGAGYYFKIYRPKQQGADSGEEFDDDYDGDEADPYGGEQDAEADYDGADWDAVDYEPDGGRLPDEDGGDGDK